MRRTPGENVDQGRLAGSVRSDQSADFAGAYRDIDAAEGREPAEAPRQAFALDCECHALARLRANSRVARPMIPCGIVNVTMTSTLPTIAGQYSAALPANS